MLLFVSSPMNNNTMSKIKQQHEENDTLPAPDNHFLELLLSVVDGEGGEDG